jgi:hypothetical protein
MMDDVSWTPLPSRGGVMARAVSFVSILGRLNPAIYDVIFPHGPIVFTRVAAGLHDRVSAVALNPQPLPPREQLQLAAVHVARDLAFAALAAEAAGHGGGARGIASAIDDWCGNGRPPRPIPWPGPWPLPWPFDTEPHKEWDVQASQVAGALSLAAIAARLGPGEIRDALAKGADQLLDAATEQQT